MAVLSVGRVPLVDLAALEASVAGETQAAVARVVGEARFILGPTVAAFERWLAREQSVAHAVGVACGSDALELALRAAGVGQGDAVVTPAVSFFASAEAVVLAGARPVFCDVDPKTLVATAETMEAAVVRARAAGLRPRALLPVHLFGRMAPMGSIAALAARKGLMVVEDAAQAMGGRDEAGRPAGVLSDAAAISFFPTKNLGAWGDAGAVVTRRAEVAERVARLRAHGATAPYVHAEIGRNSRLDAIQAAVLLAKGPHLAAWVMARGRLAEAYRAALSGLPIALPAPEAAPTVHAWHLFVIHTAQRDALAASLRARGIEARAYYPVPLHRQPCFEGLREPPLPASERACETSLALPLFPTMTDVQQAAVIEGVKGFFA